MVGAGSCTGRCDKSKTYSEDFFTHTLGTMSHRRYFPGVKRQSNFNSTAINKLILVEMLIETNLKEFHSIVAALRLSYRVDLTAFPLRLREQ